MDTEPIASRRREAATGTAGLLAALLGALAGLAVWFPYGRRGLFGAFEGETNADVLFLGLPVLVIGGAVAALAVFAAVRGRWRAALGLVAAVAGLAAVGFGFDVPAGPQALRDCGSPC
ncbi:MULTISPECIES: hypothetical protein [unclassified Streptomyces]|uniref:hypothetical protein n=1 Tax=unclassified Streptomyces TaxID=2593676 RepID=UPI000DAB8DD8|nr:MULTISPECIES: hypothetical protein [unclassified Streptomyces]PZT76057.1 hypothetical protein DNK56_22030 [Streptomyces sp. AC1-42W]PZT79992.1 hypothetical protein DNK55_10655 [Streptomyces sp. AC1-42T]